MMRASHRLPAVFFPLGMSVCGLAAAAVLSAVLPSYYVFLATSVLVAAISLLGLGIVTGRAGMIALCQMSFAVVGAWTVSALNETGVPGGPVVWLALGAAAAGLAGTLVGLPALRLRGVNLAVVTLGFAAAIHLSVVQLQFPGAKAGVRVDRPDFAVSDRSFLVFATAVMIVCSLAVWALTRSRVGAGWRSVAHSERATASAGASVRWSKLSAFAMSATLGGISGGLVTLQVGFASPPTFTPLMSLALYVLAIVSGSYLIDMALFGGLLWVAIPELLKRWGIPQDWSFVVFGALGIQSLVSGGNLGEFLRHRFRSVPTMPRPNPAPVPESLPAASPDSTALADRDASSLVAAPLLELDRVGVSFGAVVALEDVSLKLHQGEVIGLLGPNGAGKSTLIDAVTGFLPKRAGHVRLAGHSLDGLSPTDVARTGLRRTYQQDRVPPGLRVDAFVRFVARRPLAQSDLEEALAWFDCPPGATNINAVDAGTRRLVEIVAHLLARPRLLLLDEPAAGLSHEAHEALGRRLAQVPARFGTSLLLIEHDLDLVRASCTRLVVLNFGHVIADGLPDEVLANGAVLDAYMGKRETR